MDGPIEKDITYISESIINAAKISIGKTKVVTKNPKVSWWNPEIKISIQNKNRTLKLFQKTGKTEDHITLKQLRAKTCFLVKKNKVNSWKIFTSTIEHKSDSRNTGTKSDAYEVTAKKNRPIS